MEFARNISILLYLLMFISELYSKKAEEFLDINL